MGLNQAQNEVFRHCFAKFSLKLHALIACDNLVDVKPTKKIFRGPNLGQMGQNQAPNYFFFIFSSLVHWFSFRLHRVIAWNNVKLLVEVKLKNLA